LSLAKSRCLLSGLPFSLALLFFVLLALAFAGPAFSQQRWERTYGGVGEDRGRSVQQTSDGGYIVAGSSNSFGNGDQVYLIKTNAFGDTLWTRTYGGIWGSSVQQTSDGGYIVAGVTDTSGNYSQVYLVKTNASGDTLWTKVYGGTGGNAGCSVQQTSDGGYIVAGVTDTSSQVYLIKTNASGDTLWTRAYGRRPGGNFGYSVQQTSDGGYIVAGETEFLAYPQVYLIKANAQGDTLWTRDYGGTASDVGSSVQQTPDGCYIITGYTNSFGNGDQVYLLKVDTQGDTLWTRTYGGVDIDLGESVQQTSDTGYIVAGLTTSFGNGSQVYLIKTDAAGNFIWSRTFGGASYDEGRSVKQTEDGGYIIAGGTYSFGNDFQVYLIKTDADGNSGVEETSGVWDQGLTVRITAKPNPFTSFATLPGHEAERFSLYDVSGRKVGTYRGDRVGEGLAPGVYFLRPFGGNAKPLRIVKLR
jgi:hypothetical protein